MARKNSKDRGLFEQPSGSGVWWICHFDALGRRHREKAVLRALRDDSTRNVRRRFERPDIFRQSAESP